MNNQEFFSREQAAGYDPERLAAMNVLCVGAGALGQNVALNLGLSQVGRLRIVDFDRFEASNATRSPLFGSPAIRNRYDGLKAPCVAAQLAERTWWSDLPKVEYAAARLQELGDEPFDEATVVMSCVDDNVARAYIANMCHRHGTSMIEGGVSANSGSFARYDDPSGACWQCGVPNAQGARISVGCQANAIEIARQGFAPMTQTIASIVGAYMAEAAIQAAHADTSLSGRRVQLAALSNPGATVVTENRSPRCPCEHELGEPSLELKTRASAPLGELLAELHEHYEAPVVQLPSTFVATELCPGPLDQPKRRCERVVDVGAVDWRIDRHPRCLDCGGEHALSEATRSAVYSSLTPSDVELLHRPVTDFGFAPGSWLVIDDGDGPLVFATLPQGKPSFKKASKPRHRRGQHPGT